jgi:hypothetical protein
MKLFTSPADRSRSAAPDSLFGLDVLLACRRSEGFAEDLLEVAPGAPVLPARDNGTGTAKAAPAQPARGFGLRLGWLGR